MIEFGAEFHNVDHLEEVPGTEGWRLERFPRQLQNELGIEQNHNGRFRSRFVQGCEIRFVTDGDFFELGLRAGWKDEEVTVWLGDIIHSRHTLKAGELTVLHIDYPEAFKQVDTSEIPRGRFASHVWRIQFGHGGYVHFHFLDTFGAERRPPRPDEKPEISWAAYGSSITCGHACGMYLNSYVEQAAAHLGYDVMNKGLSGSCMGEEATARYLASLPVDVVSLELGVNMLAFLEPEEFEARVAGVLREMKEKSRAKKIFVIDMFDNRGRIFLNHQDRRYRNFHSFRRIVREQTNGQGDNRMVHVGGETILKSLNWLSGDLLHPSDTGHILMGRELAEKMR